MTTRLIANVLLLFVILFGGGFAGADESPYAGGLLLMRNRQGQVVCYDLRRE